MSAPIPSSETVHPDLWAKVVRLEQLCNIEMARKGDPKRWFVTMTRGSDSIVIEHESLARALTAALLAADGRNWTG